VRTPRSGLRYGQVGDTMERKIDAMIAGVTASDPNFWGISLSGAAIFRIQTGLAEKGGPQPLSL